MSYKKMTISEYAKYVKLSRQTIYKKVNSGELQVVYENKKKFVVFSDNCKSILQNNDLQLDKTVDNYNANKNGVLNNFIVNNLQKQIENLQEREIKLEQALEKKDVELSTMTEKAFTLSEKISGILENKTIKNKRKKFLGLF